MNEKLELINKLIGIVGKDGKSTIESNFFETIVSILGLSPENSLRPVTGEQISLFSLELNRIREFYQFILLIKSTGKLNVTDCALLYGISLKMGFRPECTDRILDRIEEMPSSILSDDEVMSILKSYYN